MLKVIFIVVRYGLDNTSELCAAFYSEDEARQYVGGLKEGWHSEIHSYSIEDVGVYDA